MNSKNRKIIQEIKEQTGIKDFRDGMLAAHFICRPLSRPCSVWFINHNVKPNQVTLLMILFGLVGSVLFALPNGVCKIIGYLFWILWFTMDLSDGQVARYTKTFSKYGTEMDYMAHLIDHPCMNIAIWATFIQMNMINPIILSALFMVCISCELINRNRISMIYFHEKLGSAENTKINNKKKPKTLMHYIITELLVYPTIIICFSWLIIVDYYIDNGFSLYFVIIWIIFHTINLIRNICVMVKYYATH